MLPSIEVSIWNFAATLVPLKFAMVTMPGQL